MGQSQAKEQERIELANKAKQDTNQIKAGTVVELFTDMVGMFFTQTETGKNVKKKLTEDEYIKFLHGFANSFISTLYINAAKDDNEMMKRLQYVNNVNCDLAKSVGIKHVKE